MPECYLSLGSNRGDRIEILGKALRLIDERWPLKRVSSVYETAPQIVTEQPPFLNLCCRVDLEAEAGTGGNGAAFPADLLPALHETEAALGRERRRELPKGPRTIDIDILLWGREIIREPELTIPHPGLLLRQFVLRPLLEIAPGLIDPRDGTALTAASAALPGQGVYCYHEAVVYSP